MKPIDRFHAFAAAFEACLDDDRWERLIEHFTDDATYWNVGGPDPKVEGRLAIVDFLKSDVANNDRRFDSRRLQAVSEPDAGRDRLTRRWRCTYTLDGAPDLVIEGEARYEFQGGLISSLEEEVTPESLENYVAWMGEYGSQL